jgi:hypothetical protein
LKNVKRATTKWAYEKKLKEEKELKEVEEKLEGILSQYYVGFSLDDHKTQVLEL